METSLKIIKLKQKLKKELKKYNLDENLTEGVTDYFYVNSIISGYSLKKTMQALCKIYGINVADIKEK